MNSENKNFLLPSFSVVQEVFDKVNIKLMIHVSKKELKPKNIDIFFFFLFFATKLRNYAKKGTNGKTGK